MKRILTLLLALCLGSIAANAQFSIGGAISASGSAADKTYTLEISPDFCYSFENLNVGITLDMNRFIDDDDNAIFNFGVTPYVQYYIWSSGNVSFLAEAGCSISSVRELENNPTRWIPYVSPVLEVVLSDNWCIQAGLGEFSWDSLSKEWLASLAAKEVGIGVYYSF